MSGWRFPVIVALAATLCAFAPAASVGIVDNRVVLTVGGQSRIITEPGGDILGAALSPDGKSVAYVRTEGYTAEEGSTNPTNLYLYDVASGRERVLLESREAEEPRENLKSFYTPTFSLDGGYLYVMAAAWETSSAIHQINIRTGTHRFVIDGNSVQVIRNGPHAGHLLVNRHVYRGEQGAWDPTFVVRPDGKESFMVPGSGEDETAVDKWLASNGWTAS